MAIGYQALLGHTSGANNLAIGYNAMCDTDADDCPTSVDNVFIGRYAGGGTWAGDDSNYNVGIGNSVMDAAMNGALGNVAIGYDALGSLTEGDYNTVVGFDAGDSITTGIGNVILGSGAGNGTTDVDNAVIIGRGAAQGVMTSGADGTIAIGYASLNALTSGAGNTAVGYQAGLAITIGRYSTAIGHQALITEDVGDRSTAIGYKSLYSQNSDSNNEQTGNTAVGESAGYHNVTGQNNTYVGQLAGYGASGESNSNNTAVGKDALLAVTDGAGNTSVGRSSLTANTTGAYNVAVGPDAGGACTEGLRNVFIGDTSGNWSNAITTGDYNVHIGYATSGSAVDVNKELVIAVGDDGTTGKGTLTGFIDDVSSGMYQANNSADWSTTSDSRLKKNIVDNNIGLETINKIQVRNFEYRTEDEIDELPPEQRINVEGTQIGVIAQEIQEFMPECVTELGTGVLSIDEGNFKYYLINAIQELSAKVKALEDAQ